MGSLIWHGLPVERVCVLGDRERADADLSAANGHSEPL